MSNPVTTGGEKSLDTCGAVPTATPGAVATLADSRTSGRCG